MSILIARFALIALCAWSAIEPAWSQQSGDPPSVVAWLGQTQGDVSFSPSGTDTWAYATPNRPLTTGDQVWVDRGGRAELHVGSTALRVGHESELSVTALDEGHMQWRLARGSLQVRIRTIFQDQRIEIDTPNLAFVPARPGSYRIDVDPDSGVTRITTWAGEGTVYGNSGARETIPERERVIYGGPDLDREEASQDPPADGFDRWAQARDDEESRSTAARYVSREMTGYAALDGHGAWTSDAAYGPVWIPTAVASNWAPYHYGHWAWIDPWGWTWVDDAPWGFAPFHYGRWAWLPARACWAWVPGRAVVARPVYAPALVAFVAGGSGRTRWGVSLGNGAPGVAWLPLAPGEAYRPGYRVSPHYMTRINQTIIVRNTTIVNQPNVYMNQHAPRAIAVVPSQVFAHGQHIHGTQERMPPDMFRHARFEQAAPIAPTAESRLGQARIAPVHAGSPRAEPNRFESRPWPDANRAERPWRERSRPDASQPDAARPEANRHDFGRPEPSRVMPPDGQRQEAPRPPGVLRGRPTPLPQSVPEGVPHPPSASNRDERTEPPRPEQILRQPGPARMSPLQDRERRMRERPADSTQDPVQIRPRHEPRQQPAEPSQPPQQSQQSQPQFSPPPRQQVPHARQPEAAPRPAPQPVPQPALQPAPQPAQPSQQPDPQHAGREHGHHHPGRDEDARR